MANVMFLGANVAASWSDKWFTAALLVLSGNK